MRRCWSRTRSRKQGSVAAAPASVARAARPTERRVVRALRGAVDARTTTGTRDLAILIAGAVCGAAARGGGRVRRNPPPRRRRGRANGPPRPSRRGPAPPSPRPSATGRRGAVAAGAWFAVRSSARAERDPLCEVAPAVAAGAAAGLSDAAGQWLTVRADAAAPVHSRSVVHAINAAGWRRNRRTARRPGTPAPRRPATAAVISRTPTAKRRCTKRLTLAHRLPMLESPFRCPLILAAAQPLLLIEYYCGRSTA